MGCAGFNFLLFPWKFPPKMPSYCLGPSSPLPSHSFPAGGEGGWRGWVARSWDAPLPRQPGWQARAQPWPEAGTEALCLLFNGAVCPQAEPSPPAWTPWLARAGHRAGACLWMVLWASRPTGVGS